MTSTQMGLLTGLVLGLAAAFGGFYAFLIVLVLGTVGLLAGRYLDGKLDLAQFTSRDRGGDFRGQRDHHVR
ncbi:hypothetical protein [Streptomyces sp. NPDC005283]|uniref:DUF2273 domain-containing protein n=1 Tax=Streptomyces sp. NPDC005283 TaxID=3156871 RepID=UPI0034533A91